MAIHKKDHLCSTSNACRADFGLGCMQKVKTGIQYIIAQCVGGVLGAYAAFNLLPSKFACHSLHHNDIACCIL